MAKYTCFIKNDQWKLLEPLLPKPKRSPKGERLSFDNREVLEGILWILRTGARGRIYQVDISARGLKNWLDFQFYVFCKFFRKVEVIIPVIFT